MSAPPDLLGELFAAAVSAADPTRLVGSALPESARGRTLVVGAGKAAAVMASAVEASWPQELSGVVVTRYGHAVPTRRITVLEAGHPVPDAAGVQAAGHIAALLSNLTTDDLVLGLFSGGGSALLASPPHPLTLEDLQGVTRALLSCGASISEINCVRRHLSRLQGGRLAALCHPARVVALFISDVPGDDPGTIASGPVSPDPSTCADALGVLDRYGISAPAAVRKFLEGAEESIKPGDPRLARVELRLIASPKMALEAAARRARTLGLEVVALGDDLQGEARELGAAHATIAREIATKMRRPAPPCVLLSGGETTVNVRGAGRGGRNAEYLLGAMLALDGLPGVYALAADTDGIDGTEDNAGALLGPDSLARARAAGLDVRACLEQNDSYRVFAALGDLLVTGPTRTNVNDFRAILIT